MSEIKPQNLEIVTCKDCKYWNKKQSIASIGLMLWGEQKMHIIQYVQGRIFIVKMAKGENK